MVDIRAVDVGGELPGVPIAQGGEEGLQDLGRGHDDGGAQRVTGGQPARELVREQVGEGEEGRVKRGPQLPMPLLSSRARSALRQDSERGLKREAGSTGQAHPGEPWPTVRPKREAPGGLEGLEELIGLEKGGNTPCVDEADGDDVR